MSKLTLFLCFCSASSTVLAATMQFETGAVNGVLLEHDGHRLAVYGWRPSEENSARDCEHVLLAHGRRDIVWKARSLVDAGVDVTAPQRERYLLEKPDAFWKTFKQGRFHDYSQQSTKVLAAPLAVKRWVEDGDTIDWHGLPIHVLATPGYSRGSVSYLTRVDGQLVAFTGDLIYGDGKILDLYSFQDAIPDAQIRGYHGYGARLADLVTSLNKLAAAKPDVIVPARGPIIRNPQTAIQLLKQRVQALYHNYLSTNALHWYFKEERMRACGARVLGKDAEVALMPYSHHEQTPAWVFEQGTSRLLISDTGAGFLLDCGSQRVIDTVNDLLKKKVIRSVEGIFVTHYHDDHTNLVQAAATTYNCPVYATAEYADVLQHPAAYHLPAMTENAVEKITVVQDGQEMKWHEFNLKFSFFPGQTYFHGALLASKGEEKPIFFIGDAFAPSGFDDYCVRNRNLLGEAQGYLYCLKKLRSIKTPYWLVNEHIPFVFSFTSAELDFLETKYRERIAIQRELYPWDSPNYGVDDRWAVFYPHGSTFRASQPFEITLQITNHSPKPRAFHCRLRVPPGWRISAEHQTAEIPPSRSQTLTFTLTPTGKQGDFLITADIESQGMEFREWAEALITLTE